MEILVIQSLYIVFAPQSGIAEVNVVVGNRLQNIIPTNSSNPW
jgi:hypothetical protein